MYVNNMNSNEFSMTLNDPFKIFDDKLPFEILNSYWNLKSKVIDCPLHWSKFIHATEDMRYIQFLNVFSDWQPHTYYDAMDIVLPNEPYGTDKELFTYNEKVGLISRAGKINRKYAYKLTELGNEVLSIAHENAVFSKIAKWFMPKIGDSTYAYVIDKQLKDEECSYCEDVTTKNIIELLAAFSNIDSAIHSIGSSYRWLRSFFSICNRSKDFFELVAVQDVFSFLEDCASMPHLPKNRYAEGILLELRKLQKRWAKRDKKEAAIS